MCVVIDVVSVMAANFDCNKRYKICNFS